ncbi:ABC transporter permease [Paractinoplanes brasiliensis]|uniref:Monosaccharide ABC transporter membrane protein (CUT2 family) n=1 Tax=Paractinoplanes brasiliensis TaxID=52695 RepID=A0A4V3C797_9ACTN|nr:ABC transporter permease [Actinoplanes brasiliensis]TDO36858.1 monosaccharide ABC transporter membrane protein (CUT2 family) [Actinoplanes brasiliensis]GID30375.1 ABC transporter permease [Actinoplanes brasiliensis]
MRAGRPEASLPMAALVITVIAFVFVPTYTDSALTSFDVYNTFQILARLGLLTLALGLTMIAGEFDLSVVGTYAVGGMLTVQAGQQHWAWGLLAALGAGAAIGLLQGGLIARLKIPSMPVTLATYIALLGLTSAMSGGLTKTYSNATVTLWVDQSILTYFSPRSLITLGLFVVAAAVLSLSRWGRELRAIGGDRRAARVAGVRVDRLIVGTFVASGVLSALGGSLLSFSLGSANPDPGVQPLIVATAAALLGGVSLAGGRGHPLGLLAGILAVALLAEIVAVAAVPQYVSQLFFAGLLGIIVVIDAPDLHSALVRLRTRLRSSPHPRTSIQESADV